MDAAVLRAMAKWPNVPAVFGWLSLDRRGRWRLQGEHIGNRAANAFISRNYSVDEGGRWYFQNGPQRVFVALAYTPWVLALGADGHLRTHTDSPVCNPSAAYIDDEGNLLVEFARGIGLVDDRDLAPMCAAFVTSEGNAVSDAALETLFTHPREAEPSNTYLRVGDSLIPLREIRSATLAQRFEFDPDPSPDSQDEDALSP